MKNLITTIPKGRFKTWEAAERVLRRCDGETDYGKDGHSWLWFVRTARLPKESLKESVCFMIYDGQVRGYFHVIETATIQKWRDEGYRFLTNKGSAFVVVLAHWHPLNTGVEMTGFQGWRYTALRP